jgi:hypothetical protein
MKALCEYFLKDEKVMKGTASGAWAKVDFGEVCSVVGLDVKIKNGDDNSLPCRVRLWSQKSGNVTPLHYDYNCIVLHMVLVGRKFWLTGSSDIRKNIPFKTTISNVDFLNIGRCRPSMFQTNDLRSGDFILFGPQTYHSVECLEDTIAISCSFDGSSLQHKPADSELDDYDSSRGSLWIQWFAKFRMVCLLIYYYLTDRPAYMFHTHWCQDICETWPLSVFFGNCEEKQNKIEEDQYAGMMKFLQENK